ncbi:MAG: hypothetical protein RLZZ628_2832 [Bacteroidota bacterium]|jgi:uncharacterized protein (TIGR02646 family)
MKKILDYFDSPPKNLSVKHLEKLKILEAIVVHREKVEPKHYNRAGVKTALLKIFNNCCAYCECRVSQYDAIEHFRPKHEQAYFWLGVSWSNFLIACRECNGAKTDLFEIKGLKASLPVYNSWDNFMAQTHIRSPVFVQEQPKMLHPVLDEPKEHLFFEENGTVSHKTLRGKYFIECCALSDFEKRPLLIQDRQRIVEIFRNMLKTYQIIEDTSILNPLVSTLLLNMVDSMDNQPFSAVYRACFEHFDAFFVSKFDEPYQSRLREAYQAIVFSKEV